MRFFTLLLTTAIVLNSGAQNPGTLDAGFLPNDLGFGRGDGCDGAVWSAAMQSDGKVLIGGYFWTHNGFSRARLSRVNVDGTTDASFTPPGFSNRIYCIAIQSDGKILIGGDETGGIKRLNANGTVDGTFTIGTGFAGGFVPDIQAIALQSDGKILVGGLFTTYNGYSATNVVRLNSNGTWDGTFSGGNGGLDGAVRDIAVQPDGRIVLVGDFTNYYGARGRMVRVTSTGAVDATFQSTPGANGAVWDVDLRTDGSLWLGGSFTSMHSTAGTSYATKVSPLGAAVPLNQTVVTGGTVFAITEQTDGRILLGGQYVQPFLHRLTAAGAVDPSFTVPAMTGPGSEPGITEVIVRSSGSIFIGGPSKGTIGTRAMRGCTQLNSNGTLDGTFEPGNAFNSGAWRACRQADGRTLVAGGFNAFFGTYTGSLLRLNADGSLDNSFSAWTGGQVNKILQQPDGKILLGGYFTKGVARLNTDGTVDATFNAGTGAIVQDIALLPDGKVLASGGFTQFNGISSPGLVRLNADGSVDGSFSVGSGFSPVSNCILSLQPDGKFLVGGNYTSYNGTAINRLCRLTASGALDPSFIVGTGFDGEVRELERLPDGRVFVVGIFNTWNGTGAPNSILLQNNGSVDVSYTAVAGVYPNPGAAVRYDPIGKFVVSSSWGTGPEYAGRIVRLNMNGTVDATFETGTGFGAWGINDVIIEPDGWYTIVGTFTDYQGVGRNRIARIKGGTSALTALRVKVLLEGPLFGTGMFSTLQQNGLLPATEPYGAMGYVHTGGGGGETIQAGAPAAGITDWVLVELRDANSPSTIVASQSALLKSDGNVIAGNGFSSLLFDVPHGNYFVAVRHRNHLGVMTATPGSLTDVPVMLDFTSPATATFGTEAEKTVGSKRVLWMGDVTFDHKLKYTGANNDRDAILVGLGGNPSTTITGYRREDVNLDGVVKYTGTSNDRDPILVNVGSTTPNVVRLEQVP